jgi:hypothetical protein
MIAWRAPEGPAALGGRADQAMPTASSVFAIDIESCRHCGGRLRIIASIEPPAVIERILGHLGRAAGAVDPGDLSRASLGGPRRI